MLHLIGSGKQLQPGDLERAAKTCGVETAAIKAVLSVESRKHGFDAKSRPVIEFEPHVFYRQLAHNAVLLEEAVRAGVAYPKWGERPYPRDPYPRFAGALSIDVDAALKSTSMGLAQIMGENHVAAGFATVQEMWAAMLAGEGEQLDALCKFLVNEELAPYLRAHEWAEFARRYNGPGYAQNHYDSLIAHFYQIHKADPVLIAPPVPEQPAKEPAKEPFQQPAKKTDKTVETTDLPRRTVDTEPAIEPAIEPATVEALEAVIDKAIRDFLGKHQLAPTAPAPAPVPGTMPGGLGDLIAKMNKENHQ